MTDEFNSFENHKLTGRIPTKEGTPGQIDNIRSDYLRKYLQDYSYLHDLSLCHLCEKRLLPDRFRLISSI